MAELTLRPVRLDDAELAADLMTGSYPREPEDPALTARRWKHPRQGWVFGRFIAELNGTPVAYVDWQHGPWSELPERHCWLDVYLDRAYMDEKLLTRLCEWTIESAAGDGARTMNAACGEDEPEMLKALAGLGFDRDRVDRVWSLDLRRHAQSIRLGLQAASERMLSEGIELSTLANWRDPERFEKLHDLNELTREDIPHTAPRLGQSLEDFMVRVDAPNTPPDRWWLALDGSRPVAMSYLSFPPTRGVVWTAYTGCHPAYRGRGIARAVKLQSLAQAVELGVPEVRTGNDSENAAMLHINQTLGYEEQPGFVSFIKRLPLGALR